MTPGGYCYHPLSRGNARQQVFHKPGDYEAFVRLFDAAHEIVPMRVLAYCLMPNHFHLVVWPREDGDLSRWMQWLLTTHVRRYHENHHTTGHVWQGRFKSFPIQENEHLLTVLRYAERNPLRANLVKSAGDWPYSSLRHWQTADNPKWYSAGPVSRGQDWLRHVNRAQSEGELLALRKCVERGIPYGGERWQRTTVTALGLESTLRPRGRPRKQNNEA
jgi:putative transposase